VEVAGRIAADRMPEPSKGEFRTIQVSGVRQPKEDSEIVEKSVGPSNKNAPEAYNGVREKAAVS